MLIRAGRDVNGQREMRRAHAFRTARRSARVRTAGDVSSLAGNGVGMARLLVSVRDAKEAGEAVEAGAQLVDFNDPAAGALGALEPREIRAGIIAVQGRCATSASIGDLPVEPEALEPAVARVVETFVTYVRVGLWASARRAETIEQLGARFASQAGLSGVLFADAEPDYSMVPLMAEHGFAGAILDVAGKSRGLLDLVDHETLTRFTALCRRCGLLSGFSGSLRIGDIPLLVALRPDILGLRGGVCEDFDRTRALFPAAVRQAALTIRDASPVSALRD